MPDKLPIVGPNTQLQVRAPAKINLVLEVVSKRSDGYHEINSVLTTINLADELVLSPSPTDGLQVHISGSHATGVDPNDDLSGRAALLLAEAAGRPPYIRIDVTKHIPVAAGLGGGSSDAAAVLRGLNHLWGLDWPIERLIDIGSELGSDVPFFLHGGTAHCTGRGEQVAPLPDVRPLRLLLLSPPLASLPDKTARRYQALTEQDFSLGEYSERLAKRVKKRAAPSTSELVNVFEAIVERTETELVAHYSSYRTALSGHQVHLCGSGPTLYVLVQKNFQISELRHRLEGAGATVLEARTLPRQDALSLNNDA